jgi:hypothetical protein
VTSFLYSICCSRFSHVTCFHSINITAMSILGLFSDVRFSPNTFIEAIKRGFVTSYQKCCAKKHCKVYTSESKKGTDEANSCSRFRHVTSFLYSIRCSRFSHVTCFHSINITAMSILGLFSEVRFSPNTFIEAIKRGFVTSYQKCCAKKHCQVYTSERKVQTKQEICKRMQTLQ